MNGESPREPDRASEALRKAIELTLEATAGSAGSARERAGLLVDEVVRQGRGAGEEVARRGQEAGDELARRGQELGGELARRGQRVADHVARRIGGLISNPKAED